MITIPTFTGTSEGIISVQHIIHPFTLFTVKENSQRITYKANITTLTGNASQSGDNTGTQQCEGGVTIQNKDIVELNGEADCKLTSIGQLALAGCPALEKATIPVGVKTIGDNAFYRDKNLESVSIPSTVTTIGSSAFSNCENLPSITIPGSVRKVSEYMLFSCKSLTQITIQNGVKQIEKHAFDSCTSMQSIQFPASVTTAGDALFTGCTSLQSVDLGGLTQITEAMFAGCESLSSLSIPQSATAIGNRSFQNCTALSQITFPASISSIGDSAFEKCISLVQISIPETVQTIGDYAFKGCTSLATISMRLPSQDYSQSLFTGCTGMKTITLTSQTDTESEYNIGEILYNGRQSVETIDFSGCSALQSIPQNMFNYLTALKTVVLPDTVTTIGSNAFSDCTTISNVTARGFTIQDIKDNCAEWGIKTPAMAEESCTFTCSDGTVKVPVKAY